MTIIKFLDKIFRMKIKNKKKELEDKGIGYDKGNLEKKWITADWKGGQTNIT